MDERELMDDIELFKKAYDKIIKENLEKIEKQRKEQEREEQERRKQELSKINVDPSILKRVDEELAVAKAAEYYRQKVKQAYEK